MAVTVLDGALWHNGTWWFNFLTGLVETLPTTGLGFGALGTMSLGGA